MSAVNGIISGWQPVTRTVPQGSILSPVMFSIFINVLNAGAEYILIKTADSVKLGSAADSLE